MMGQTFKLCFILLLTLTSSVARHEKMDQEDTSQWVDPMDMGSPAPQTGNLAECKKQLTEASVTNCNCSSCSNKSTSIERPFFKRHVKSLIRHFDLQDPSTVNGGRQYVLTTFGLTPDHLKAFRSYGYGATTNMSVLHDLDEALEKLFASVKQDYDDSYYNDDYTGVLQRYLPSVQDVFWLCIIFFVAGISVLLWCSVPVWKLLTLLMVVSTGWHWVHMYKMAIAKKMSTLVAAHKVPQQCFPDTMSFAHMLHDTVFKGKPDVQCRAYHEAVLVDPFFEVSPLLALSETVSKLVFHPLEHFGQQLGKFFHQVLQENSYLAAPAVLPSGILLLTLVIVIATGYRIRLPFFLGAIEPSGSSSKEAIDINTFKQLQQQLVEAVADLKQVQQRQLQAMEQQQTNQQKISVADLTQNALEVTRMAVEDIKVEKEDVEKKIQVQHEGGHVENVEVEKDDAHNESSDIYNEIY